MKAAMRLYRQLSLCILLCTYLGVAQAGLLRERLSEQRRIAQGQDVPVEWLDNDSASSSAPKLPPGARLLSDVSYGNDPRQRMDVYIPARASGATLILMVHGGAWRTGDKAHRPVVDNKLARWLSQGMIFVSVNYRLLPRTDPLEQANDVARALAVAQSSATDWGGDPSRFILMGHSAGAHLVALLGAAPDRARALGARPWLGVVSLDSGALDVVEIMERKHYRFYDSAFGQDSGYWAQTSPYHQLSSNAFPFLLVCSSRRPDRPCTQAQQFAKRASGLGIRGEVLAQPLSHGEINSQLGLPGTYTDAVEKFMFSLYPNR